jgi:DNA-binding MarR family transcriptional regulator/GNAT superfamily N-acetyltransferase
MDSAAISQVRAFNRTVTERIGALEDRYLRRGRSLGESRLLWEIGTDGAEVRTLRQRLNLDSGYLSRILRSLEKQGLIKVSAGREDARVRRAHLTRAGLHERAELDRRSDALALSILESLADPQRQALLNAMGEVDRLLQASLVSFAVEDPASADAQWCFNQYFSELNSRFESGFDPARSISLDARELVPPRGVLVIARLRARPVGCGALRFHQSRPAELKRMWIAPESRGLGVARRLLAALEQRAKEADATTIRLETNRALKEAIQLYRSSGYREVGAFNREAYAHHWFEKRLTRRAPKR